MRDGYAALSTNHVAKEAGISVGTIYQYFPNKMALVYALQERIARQDMTQISEVFDSLADQDIVASMSRVLSSLVSLRSTHADLRSVLQEQVPVTSGAQDWAAEVDEVLANKVEEAIVGKVPHASELDVPVVVYTLMRAVDNVTVSVAIEHPDWVAEGRLNKVMIDMVAGLLRVPVPER